ncbi:MAG: hypothetical protein A3F74_02745 [Betaproteobacteria bacterium RIFCSPLOWO2_12_FULL_62_58]|nr:MAG: hypothetical protein A3I62_01945 [Betaproteobacteria bacterium RIFCSPLOWO2_02_FULL_62_79]OGA47823.1 MAG: hypothetical protein A3F74_02745 [Betaproteobacteria bacterium RIFCSPLOWO2_12_FULL_62_58]
MKFALGILIALFAAALAVSDAAAQQYPSRPIRLIVPFTPGGTTDIVARVVGNRLAESLGVQVVIENRPGAAGSIGAEVAARSKPDGYTLFMGHIGTLAVNPALYAKLPYDPLRDFAPISMVTMVPSMLVVHPSLPVKSMKELMAFAKSHPGALTYGSTGAGGTPYLAVEYFKVIAKLDIVEVPYKGAAPMTTELISGEISLTITGIPALLPHVKSGRLRALAVSSAKRSAAVPELPTMGEAGLRGYEATAWYGIVAPAGTAREILVKLNAEVISSLKHPDVGNRLKSEGAEPGGSTPNEFAAFIKTETARWAEVIKTTGVKQQ